MLLQVRERIMLYNALIEIYSDNCNMFRIVIYSETILIELNINNILVYDVTSITF